MKRKASGGTRMNTRHALWRRITVSFSLVLVLSLVLASPALADIKLRVRVIDCNGQPIEGARVKVTTSKTEIGGVTEGITGPDGWTTISPVKPGDVEHTIRVTKQGFKTQEVTQWMEAWSTQEVVVKLIPETGFCQPLVEPPPLARIDVTPSEVTMNLGEDQQFQAKGYDAQGNEVPLTSPVWETSGGGTLDPACQGSTSCPYTATEPGDNTVTCTQGGTDIYGTATVHVKPPPLARIDVTPSEVTMNLGEDQQFQAKGYDAQGNEVPLTSPVWETSGGGTLTPSGTSATYTATEPGSHTITCREGGTSIEGMAAIDVTVAGVGGVSCPVGLAPLAGLGIGGLVVWRRRPAGKR